MSSLSISRSSLQYCWMRFWASYCGVYNKVWHASKGIKWGNNLKVLQLLLSYCCIISLQTMSSWLAQAPTASKTLQFLWESSSSLTPGTKSASVRGTFSLRPSPTSCSPGSQTMLTWDDRIPPSRLHPLEAL